MYASARMRALENRLIGRERLELLLEARTSDEVMERLAEYGLTPPEEESPAPASALAAGTAKNRAREEMLLAVLRAAYAEADAAAPDASLFRYFRYPYDANNLKAAIKCGIRGIPAEDMLFDFGTVPAGEVEALVREGKYGLFPAAMAVAASQAREAYDKSGDPRRIDAILDRACFADMLAGATMTGDETLIGWVKARIDLINILICLRILRMKRGEVGATFLRETLLPGGTLEPSFFEGAYAGGEVALWEALGHTPYCALRRVEGEPRSLGTVEKAADDLWMNTVRDGARIPFGAAVIGGYLVGWETAVKNLRILLAGKDAGLSPEALRERIRVSYV